MAGSFFVQDGYSDVPVNSEQPPYVLARSAVPASVGSVTTEQVLATVTVPGGALGPNGWVIIWSTWSSNSNSNSKTCRIRLGGSAGTAIFNSAVTTSLSIMRPTLFANVNSQSVQKTSSSAGQGGSVGTSGGSLTTTSVDTSQDFEIVFTGQKANASDTLALESYIVTVCYGA